jgi:hypothetical protein
MKHRPSHLVFVAACLAWPVSSVAQTTQAQCETVTLHSTNSGSGIDRRIPREIAVQVSKPPFSAYNSWRMLDRSTRAATAGQPFEVQLPSGRAVRVTWRPGPRNDRALLDFALLASGNATPLAQTSVRWGEFFIIVAHNYQGGNLALATRCSR